jgi:hypothetical protein
VQVQDCSLNFGRTTPPVRWSACAVQVEEDNNIKCLFYCELSPCSPMCRRLIWALAHSTVRADQQRGLDLAQAALDNDARTQDQDRELRYFLAGERHVSACAVAVARCCCACMCANVRPCFRVPCCYLARVTAVAMFKLGRCLDARRALASLLQARTHMPASLVQQRGQPACRAYHSFPRTPPVSMPAGLP